MKNLKKIATAFCAAALGMLTLTGCEGSELYSIGAPDWISDKVDSIAAAKAAKVVTLIPTPETLGAEDNSQDWWSVFTDDVQLEQGKTYQIPLTNYGGASNWNNFVIILRNAAKDYEYAVLRADNWGWGTGYTGEESAGHFDKSIESDSRDWGAWAKAMSRAQCMITIIPNPTTVDVKITMVGANGVSYSQNYLNVDINNSPEDLYLSFTVDHSHIVFGVPVDIPDSNPASLKLNGLPSKALLGTTFDEAIANLTAEITFEDGMTKTVGIDELELQVIPDFETLGTKTLVAVYNKTFKGEAAVKPVIGTTTINIVDKMFTCIGKTDNSSGFREEKSENFKVAPGETYVHFFTNYTNGAENWNNFIITLCKADGTEYGFVRADNWGIGDCYWDGCQSCNWDWANFKTILNGAKVTTYITNNGDGTADVKAVVLGSDGNTYTQSYTGLKNIDANDFCFNLSMEKAHLEFDKVIGAEDNSSAFRADATDFIAVPAGRTIVNRFINYTNGAENWNNFIITLYKADGTEYGFVRADNWGIGDCYWDGCQTCDWDWTNFKTNINEAKVTTYITNNGDGTADVKAVAVCSNGNTYTQNYKGLKNIDANDFGFRLSMEKAHLVFE